MNQKVDLKKKLLKEALSKNQGHRKDLNKGKALEKVNQNPTTQPIKLQRVETIKTHRITEKQYKISKSSNSINASSQSTIQLDNSMNGSLEQYSQKLSCRSSFSQSLYTAQTEDVKESIYNLFEKKKFIEQFEKKYNKNSSSHQLLQDLRRKIMSNQIFVLSLEARLKEKRPKQKEQIIEQEINKKLQHLIELDYNQKECLDAERRIEHFLQEKLRKIKRKEF